MSAAGTVDRDVKVPVLDKLHDGRDCYVYEDIPIFDEHETEDGIKYDRALLQCIAANNNDRIADTGDLVPIVGHHTPEDKDPAKDPEIVGFADQFTVKRFGKKKPRWAIYARFRIHKDKIDTFRNRPRRSVEIWPEDKPENSYIDPIALLGAETPRRDLGMITYAKTGARQPYRYSMSAMTAPSGTNTSAPDMIEMPDQNSKGDSMTHSFSPEQINQLLDAFKPVIQEMVSEAMVGKNGDADLPMDNPSAPPAGPVGGDMPMPESPAGDEGEPPIDDDDDMAAAGGMAKRFSKRSCGVDGSFDEEVAKKYINAMDSEDRKLLSRYMKHHCDDADQRERYCKCTGQNQKKGDEKSSNGPEMYRKQYNDMSVRYQKVVEENKALKAAAQKNADAVAEANKAARYAKRHAALAELAQVEGYVLDADEEMNECNRMTDDEFGKHIEKVRRRYQKVPIGATGFEADFQRPVKYAPESKSQKYAKSASKVVFDRRAKNLKDIPYQDVLEWMINNDSDKFPE